MQVISLRYHLHLLSTLWTFDFTDSSLLYRLFCWLLWAKMRYLFYSTVMYFKGYYPHIPVINNCIYMWNTYTTCRRLCLRASSGIWDTIYKVSWRRIKIVDNRIVTQIKLVYKVCKVHKVKSECNCIYFKTRINKFAALP